MIESPFCVHKWMALFSCICIHQENHWRFFLISMEIFLQISDKWWQLVLTRREDRTKRCRLEAKLRTSEAIVAVKTLKWNYFEKKLSNKNKNSEMKLCWEEIIQWKQVRHWWQLGLKWNEVIVLRLDGIIVATKIEKPKVWVKRQGLKQR